MSIFTKKNIKKFLYSAVSFIIAAAMLIPAAAVFAEEAEASEESAGKVLVFLYHHLYEDELPEDALPEYCTTAAKFEEDITSLLEAGYTSISLEQYYAEDYDKTKNCFIITFDDGYSSNYEIAYPILVEHEVYGDIFINTDITGTNGHFRNSEATEMENSGFIKVYSHFTTHVPADSMDAPIFKALAKRSLRHIDKKIRGEFEKNVFFAYPHGAYTLETAQILKELGVKLQLVQSMPKDFDGEEYGFVHRINVAYYSDVLKIAEDYFA